jgi:hypothetical protein
MSGTEHSRKYTHVESESEAEDRLSIIEEDPAFLKYSCTPSGGGEIHSTGDGNTFEIRKPNGITFEKCREEVLAALTECKSLVIHDISRSLHTGTHADTGTEPADNVDGGEQ